MALVVRGQLNKKIGEIPKRVAVFVGFTDDNAPVVKVDAAQDPMVVKFR